MSLVAFEIRRFRCFYTGPFWRCFNTFCFGLLFVLGSAWCLEKLVFANTPPSDPFQIIQSLGLEVLNSETPMDFTVEDLAGVKKSLSDFKGQWVWLTFWATWCGVCIGEMPSLESLYQEMKSKNMTVLGISIDQDKTPVENYLKKSSITFPILLDTAGKAASIYKANAVPTVYLISPDWKLVGLARGALNWERKEILAKVSQLLSFKEIPTGPALDGEKKSTQQLLPPKLELVVPKELMAGKWLGFDVQIQWPGPSRQYVIKVPKFEVPEGIKTGEISSSTLNSSNVPSVENSGTSILKYRFPLWFKEKGKYKLGPIDLSYRSRASKIESDQTTRSSGTTVEIVKARLLPVWLSIVLGAIVLLTVAIGIFMFIKVKKQERKKIEARSKEAKLTEQKWDLAYQDAKKYKLNGRTRDYCLGLISICQSIRDQHPEIRSRVHDIETLEKIEGYLEKIRYGDRLPQESEIVRLEKIIEWSFQKEGST